MSLKKICDIRINITIGEKNFIGVMQDNKTTRFLTEKLPMTINMIEMEGKEKYCFTEQSFPTDASRPGHIEIGDIMLYGNNCVVIFYKNFRSIYSYTRLGRIENTEGLKEALGSGSIKVTISKECI